MRHHDDVVLRSQVGAGLHVILVDQVERNLPAIEREADPADLLGVRPGRVHRDARQIDVDGLDRRAPTASGRGDQTERLDLLAHAIARPDSTINEPAGNSTSPTLNAAFAPLIGTSFRR